MYIAGIVATHLLEVVDPAKVIDEPRRVERVEAGEAAEAGGVVVVAVDAEDRHGDVHVGVAVVDLNQERMSWLMGVLRHFVTSFVKS